MDIHLELAEFLMNDLAATYSDFDSDSTFAFSVVANIAIVGDSIPESLMLMYTAPVSHIIDSHIVDASIAYFHGAGILSVTCDCAGDKDSCFVDDLNQNVWNQQGSLDAVDGSPMYNRAVTDVSALRHAIY